MVSGGVLDGRKQRYLANLLSDMPCVLLVGFSVKK